MEYSDGENDSDVEIINYNVETGDLFDNEAHEYSDAMQSDNEKQENQEASKIKVNKEKQTRGLGSRKTFLIYNTLEGSNGLSALKKLFKNFKFKGSGNEKEDLIKIMEILQQWMCYQLCPRYNFENCMQLLEVLGKSKRIQVLIKKFRLGIDEWGGNQPDTEIVTDNNLENENSNKNEFDLLLEEEMANIGSEDELSQNEEVPIQQNTQMEAEVILTSEQLERIARNKKLAEERRLMRLKEKYEEMEMGQTSEKMGDQEISFEKINLDENS